MQIRKSNNIINLNISVILVIIIFFVFACKKENLENVSFSDNYLYYPLNVGHYIIYDVDTSYMDPSNPVKITKHYQLKEYIESNFIDNSGRNTQRIERYIRKNDTTQWIIRNVWYANSINNNIEKVEDNIRYVKLIFPIKIHKQWDGNAFNVFDMQKYEYTSIENPYVVNGINYPNTLTVTQKDETSLIHKDYAVEVYAKNIGLIYKRSYYMRKNPDITDNYGNVIEQGDTLLENEVVYKIKNYY